MSTLLNKHVLALLVLCIAVFQLQPLFAIRQASISTNDDAPPSTRVWINNTLDGDRNFTIRCQAGDEVSGYFEIPWRGFYKWVRPGEPKDLRCHMFCLGIVNGQLVQLSGVFDFYKFDRDRKRCPENCVWAATHGGIFGYPNLSDNLYDLFLDWPYTIPVPSPPPVKRN